MFNNQSQHTKERRRQAFDDFLRVLTTMNPLPIEVADFLELCANAPAEARSSSEIISGAMQCIIPGMKAAKPQEESVQRSKTVDKKTTVGTAKKSERTDLNNEIGKSKDLTIFLSLLPTSVVFVLPIYAGLIFLEFIDISSTTIGKKICIIH